ncbi:hypothetical protein TSTA_061880 [Talaromyces stipitatus ATCC 10500]|uniref:Uncharacterized protein n=1 Tax=Talaromyces stipitatus (strain ATCC 10500 / CBS 375.48 / QM 6759 / NRRL 1006) TaxID=441959 RepID=B8LX50_TALSN|nr:uncharacterized protein TSTA_061880 [Talaromyces stipitatus ATCC 10500]EED22700.1 hypothetical protein TSTA_061880 [Talaromyces stipitatus ATCC 10500]
MLRCAHRELHKPYIFRLPALSHGSSIDESSLRALEMSLDKIKSKAIPLEWDLFLAYPQTGDELRKIQQHCKAKLLGDFPFSDYVEDEYQWQASLCCSLEAYRNTGKEWLDWMELTLKAAKSFELQAAHKIADVSPQHFAATKFRCLKPLWVVWGKKTEEGTAEETKELNSFLEDHGISVADAPHILPLRYGLFEVWFEENRRAELRKLFSKTYTDFDEDSPLVRFQGYCESLRIVLDAYKKQSNFWGEVDVIVKRRMDELGALTSRAKI